MENRHLSFEAIGTHWEIDINENISHEVFLRLSDAIHARIDAFDKTYSRFRADSLITEMSKAEGVYRFPEDAELLFFLYERLFRVTKGKVTPLIGNVLADAGYDANYSFITKTLHAPLPWEDVLEYRHPFLTLKQPVLLDFGAAGKGYLVDIIAALIEEHGVHAFVVDAGGDMINRSKEGTPLRVGLEHPEDASKVIGVLEIGNESICGSAGNRRKWNDLTHIIDPETLVSPSDITATWVVADTAIIADALATCLFFTPPELLAKEFTFEYVVMKNDHEILRSRGLQGEFF